MSEQSTQNPTPTVQVKEVGLPEQASIGKVLLVAGAAAGVTAGLVALLSEKKEEVPPSKTESAREYLRVALEEAQKKDLGKVSRRQRKRAEKNFRKQQKKVSKDAEKLVKQGREVASDSAAAVREEVSSIMDAVRSGNIELDKIVEGFAESALMAKLKEFGDEAKEIAEQGKMRGEEAAHRVQDEVIPQAKDAAKRVQEEVIPQAKEAAREAGKAGKEKFSEVSEKARKEYIPAAQEQTAEAAAHAREVVEQVSDDAEKLLAEAAQKADKKRKDATAAVQRGGRETRSLLLWLSLAGILIFTVFLDEEQQKKLKEIAFEVFGEARDMYSDMKGDTTA